MAGGVPPSVLRPGHLYASFDRVSLRTCRSEINDGRHRYHVMPTMLKPVVLVTRGFRQAESRFHLGTFLPRSLTLSAVFSPPSSVYFTLTCAPSLTSPPASFAPSMAVLSVYLIVCSVPSFVFTTIVFVSLSTCFTTPETMWVRSSADALCRVASIVSATTPHSRPMHSLKRNNIGSSCET